MVIYRHGKGNREGGRFARKDEALPAREIDAKLRRLKKLSEDDLLAVAHEAAQLPPGPDTDARITKVMDELVRREGLTKPQDDPAARRLDALLADGLPFVDAYAEAYGGDPATMRREERLAMVQAARRPGERRADTIRRLYRETVALEYLAAEQATNGHMLNARGRAKGISAATLFGGPWRTANAYASDELREFWESTPRRTLADFTAEILGDNAQATREATRKRSGELKR